MLCDGFCEVVRPNYIIRYYTSGIYKVSYFPNGAPLGFKNNSEPHNTYDHKLDPSISRSRRIILEKGLCNEWDYFCTFTISDCFGDRSDLSNFREKFSQFIRDQRKKYRKLGIDLVLDFLLVPELHSDGKSWHMHGLFRGIGSLLVSFADWAKQGHKVDYNLVKGGYYNWPDYCNKFGYCSFGPIKNKVAASFYITKYLYKSLDSDSISVGSRSVFCSKGLSTSDLHGEVYGHCTYLDKFLTNNYEFCKTGFTHVKDGVSWDFALEYMDVEPFNVCSSEEEEVDRYVEYTQLGFQDLEEMYEKNS